MFSQPLTLKLVLFVLYIMALSVAGCSNEQAPGETALPPASSEAPPAATPATGILALMAAANVPGLAMATIDNCEVSDTRYFGVTDVDSGVAVGPRTQFEAASLTKTMFALIVWQLAEEGVIDLDQPLAATFDYPRISDKAQYAALTPRLILMHMSGLPNWAADPGRPETWGDIPFKNAPGESFGYSGEGFQLLQSFIESTTGQSFDELFTDRLATVMPDTALRAQPSSLDAAFGHDEFGSKADGRPLKTSDASGAAFSATTTASDYAAFLGYVCKGAGLTEDNFRKMLEPQSATKLDAVLWSLGWGVQDADGRRVYFHWGDNGHFKAFTAFDMQQKAGVVFFANAMNGLKLIEPLAESVVGDLDPVIEWLEYGRIE